MNDSQRAIEVLVNRVISNQLITIFVISTVAVLLLLFGRRGDSGESSSEPNVLRYQLIDGDSVFDRATGVVYERGFKTITEFDFVSGHESSREIRQTKR